MHNVLTMIVKNIVWWYMSENAKIWVQSRSNSCHRIKNTSFLNPLIRISGCTWNNSYTEMSQLALFALMTADTSMLTSCTGTDFSCFCPSSADHEWKLLLRWSLIGCLTEISSGCSLLVQFGGTCTEMMHFGCSLPLKSIQNMLEQVGFVELQSCPPHSEKYNIST